MAFPENLYVCYKLLVLVVIEGLLTSPKIELEI